METNDIIPSVNETDAARTKFEQERMGRRAALRKLGMTGGMALFSLLAVDDLARMAVKKLAQHQETKAIADSIAHDFKDMGVAFADDGGDGDYYDGGPCTPNNSNTDWCGADGHRKEGKHNLKVCQECVQGKENGLANDMTLKEGCADAADQNYPPGRDRADALNWCEGDYINNVINTRLEYANCCSIYRCSC